MPIAFNRRKKSGDPKYFKVKKPTPKRPKINSASRSQRISHLKEDLEDVKAHWSLAEKQRTKYSNTQQYSQEIVISEKIVGLRGKQRECQSELTCLLAKEAKALKNMSKSTKVKPAAKPFPVHQKILAILKSYSRNNSNNLYK